MIMKGFILVPLIILLFVTSGHASQTSDIELPSEVGQSINANEMKTYIIHLTKSESRKLLDYKELESWHKSFLPNLTLDSGEPRLVYSYFEVMIGFAAKLTPDEVQVMQHMDSFLHAELDVQKDLLETTYTPKYLGLSDPSTGIWHTESNMGEGIVIGVIDSGIPRNHPSFSDDQMPTKPANWKGNCNFTNFTCNKKIIGGGTYGINSKVTDPPVDTGGHGSHVASIATGNFVKDAMVVGKYRYTASGMAPRAHLAIYKTNLSRADSLKSYDQAMIDGVNIINYSISAEPTDNFYLDTAAFSGYKATKKGISVSVSAGNRGAPKSLSHSAPWLMVVGASWPDRRLAATVRLGNGDEFIGETGFYQPTQFNSSNFLPIVYPGANNKKETLGCWSGSLNGIDVKNKIVLCWAGDKNINKGSVVRSAGGAAMILMGSIKTTRNDQHVLPVCHVNSDDARKILAYYTSLGVSPPNATIIFNGQVSGRRPAPTIATNSSSGPSLTNGGILKPDVIAPGYEILGASIHKDNPFNNYFKFDTGTSMASPHVVGVMALLKKKYPTWSPAAIQSAIITTADDVDLAGNPFIHMKNWKPSNIFDRGAGHINPIKAMNPGLVYDRNFNDYIGYMCFLNYNPTYMQRFNSRKVDCSKEKKIKPSQLNYPSIMVTLSSNSPDETVMRTVTNVGNANSDYTPRIFHPANANLILSTNRLQFSAQNQQLSFNVKITIGQPAPVKGTISEGKLEWVSTSGGHVVRSPIAVVFG
ncbi:subtilisin-like protease 4 [Dioscorea cayenensis subsp. rotundata]|uniref:Subtilisin-like protease 4 n=1 Tax=Dioscorea cayennensis subsp. rotundata TaxID=55577 RepID=A0AB40AXY0_DIOCR|nr:subtilisin-like protease 4 [Dioscorea cayenensis subsp. rotundata]